MQETGLIESGKIPYAEEQLSLCVTTIEPVLWSPGTTTPEDCILEPVLHSQKNHYHEKPKHCNRKALTASKTQ